jgi:hypothetical protein
MPYPDVEKSFYVTYKTIGENAAWVPLVRDAFSTSEEDNPNGS